MVIEILRESVHKGDDAGLLAWGTMNLQRAHEFLRRNHRAVLVTRHPDGRPQLSPVTCGVDDEGRAVVSTRRTAIKTRNILLDPHVSLCAMNDAFFGDWLQIDGVAN